MSYHSAFVNGVMIIVDHRVELRRRKERKTDVLLEQKYSPKESKITPSHRFYPRVINLSGVVLSKEENDLIGKGVKGSVPPRNIKKSLDQLTTDLAIRLIEDRQIVNQCADLICNHNSETYSFTPIYKTINNIFKTLKDHDFILTKADKGNSVAILKREK